MRIYREITDDSDSQLSVRFSATDRRDGLQRHVEYQVDPGETVDVGAVVADGRLIGQIIVNGFSLPFELDGVSNNDNARLSVGGTSFITLQVDHVGVRRGRCVARCADGTENSPCVTCRLGPYEYRICC